MASCAHNSLANAAERLHADDQADAGNAGDNAEQLARGHRLVAGDDGGQQKGENRRGRIQDGGKTGIDVRSAQAISVNGMTLLRQA